MSRPALADVVAVLTGDRALTEFWRVALKPYAPPAKIANRVEVSDRGVATFDVTEGLRPIRRVALQPWRVDLAPPDDERRRWHGCPTCKRRGPTGATARARATEAAGWVCGECHGDFRTPHPPGLPSLVAVAALGVGDWLRAEALARVIEPGAAVVWRVMTATALRKHMHEVFNEGKWITKPSHVAGVAWFFPDDVPDALAWWSENEASRAEASNAIVELASVGVWLLGAEHSENHPGRVTLAVEALA